MSNNYERSDAIRLARDKLEKINKEKPTYTPQYTDQLKEITEKINNREKFSYDLNGDALYQQYKDQATREGEAAMEDAIGRASAMTGGFGNSYAQTVGQQAYQEHFDALNDKIPELFQLALDKYDRERSELYDRYSLLSAQEQRDYNRHRDEVGDWEAERRSALEELGYEVDSNQSVEGRLDALVEAGVITQDEADEIYTKHMSAATDTEEPLTSNDNAGNVGATPEKLQDMFNNADDWDPTQDGWKVISDGGWNWGGGIDKNAKVLAPNGTTYTIHGLYNELVEELMATGYGESKAKKDAEKMVVHLQKKTGITGE